MEDFTNLLNITYNNVRPKRGKVLISQPLKFDGCFSRSVVLLADYSKDGAIGFILNKWLQIAIDDLIEDFPAGNSQLSIGGPVAFDSLHYLHSFSDIPGAIEIMNGVYWGGHLEVVHNLLSSSVMRPDDIRFFLGYSGWTGGQLDNELRSDSWLVGDILPAQIIRSSRNLWRESVRNVGDEYLLWTNMPANPLYN